ncbi:MAG: hypothetical protein H6Q67_1487 [Firmicutes bacterium]|nr:hypothetical protein [Bacillota bacterium]
MAKITAEQDREDEISATLTLIQEICLNANIALLAKDHKGTLLVIVRDERNGKEYGMCKK